ncbi:hypothetical protein RQP46_010901 [Phenoliferia psychrophenolica]
MARARAAAIDGRGRFPRFKEAQLAALYNIVSGNQASIIEAIHTDSGRPTSEIGLELAGVARYTQSLFKLAGFSHSVKQEQVKSTEGTILIKPVGLVLIISADFAPLDSLISPIARALLSGNTIVGVFPPRHSALEAVLAPLLLSMDRGAVSIISYSVESIQALIAQAPDAIFATTRSATLRETISTSPAPSTLVPRSLGLNAAVIDKISSSQSMATIAKAVARGNFLGLGRGLGSVDYVLVHEELNEEFLAAVKVATTDMYGSDPSLSRDYGRILDHELYRSLVGALRDDFASGTGRVVLGGDVTYVFARLDAVTYLSRELSSTVFASHIPFESLVLGISSSAHVLDAAFFETGTKVILKKASEPASTYPPFTSAGLAKHLPSEQPLHVTRAPHSNPFLSTKRIHRVPIGFGPAPGPRQGPDGQPFGTWGESEATTVGVTYVSEHAYLNSILPEGYETDPSVEAVIMFEVMELRKLPWLNGRGYNTWGVYIANVISSSTDPITTGREELGFCKVYADLPDGTDHSDNSRTHTASWFGSEFMRLDLPPLIEKDVALAPAHHPRAWTHPTQSGILHHRYVPTVGKPGFHDASYTTWCPAPSGKAPVGSYHTIAPEDFFKVKLEIAVGDWATFPTLHNVIEGLRLIPRGAILEVAVQKFNGASDLRLNQKVED